MKTPNTTCRRGHALVPENIYCYTVPGRGVHRVCKACKAIRQPAKGTYKQGNAFRLEEEVGYIGLTKAKEAIVDAQELNWILKASHWSITSSGYVQSKNLCIQLHRFILNAPDGVFVDHINRNPLDCRRQNLRLVTHGQNLQNQRIYGKSTCSGVRNVYWVRQIKKWEVKVRLHGKSYGAGYFKEIGEAVKAASELRQRIHSHCPENSLPVNG